MKPLEQYCREGWKITVSLEMNQKTGQLQAETRAFDHATRYELVGVGSSIEEMVKDLADCEQEFALLEN